jgi:multicomponent Na+:H+ antiporter subunit C
MLAVASVLDWVNSGPLSGEVVAILLFFIGLLGIIVRRNMMLTIIASGIMDVAVILFFLVLFASPNVHPPMVADSVAMSADPIPQGLMITSVVLGVSVEAVCLVLTMITFSEYGTLDWRVAQRIRDGLQPAVPAEASGSSSLLFSSIGRNAGRQRTGN